MPLPSAVLIFAHPDDESVALGARLERFGSAYLLHVTDGAPRNEEDSRDHGFTELKQYRRARAEELARALEAAGVSDISRKSLEVSDQEAALQLAQVTHRIYQLLLELQPQVIFTHPYEGGHPDHDACAFAVHHAVNMLGDEGPVPMIIEAAFYRAGPHGITAGEFLPCAERTVIEYSLSPAERNRKQELFNCFTTQREMLKNFPLDREQFRIAPKYDFRKPPHRGPVLYDRFPWGMDSARFCQLAQQAEDALRAQES